MTVSVGTLSGTNSLCPSGRDSQQFFQFNGNTFIDGCGASLAALALDGNGLFPEGLFRNSCVDAVSLIDTQSNVLGQAGDGGKVLMAVRHTDRQKAMELPDTPGSAYPVKAAALQLRCQFVVRG